MSDILLNNLTGSRRNRGTSPVVIQVRHRSGRIVVSEGIPWPMLARETFRLCEGIPTMDRRPRAFQPVALPLERRILLASVPRQPHAPSPLPTPPTPIPKTVWFFGAPSSAAIAQQTVPQGDEATVTLRTNATGTAFQVTTDPSSPAVGVNLPAFNQTVTSNNQGSATLTIPTTAGAPNPGEVDVDLTITPIDPPPGLSVQGPLELRIVAPDATTPPGIIDVAGTANGIVLAFSKPMNPVQASNVNNYTVRKRTAFSTGKNFLTALGSDITALGSDIYPFLSPETAGASISTRTVPLRAAEYDPANDTVTLVPKRPLTYKGYGVDPGSITVSQGSPTKTSGRGPWWVKLGPRSH